MITLAGVLTVVTGGVVWWAGAHIYHGTNRMHGGLLIAAGLLIVGLGFTLLGVSMVHDVEGGNFV